MSAGTRDTRDMARRAGRLLVVGIGNPILSDDGVGWRVASAVEALLAAGHPMPAGQMITVLRVCAGGLALAEALIDYEGAVIVDAALVPYGTPGAVRDSSLDELSSSLNTSSAHDLTLPAALHLLRSLGARVPPDESIRIVMIEAADVWTFGEAFSPNVEASVAEAARRVLEALADLSHEAGMER